MKTLNITLGHNSSAGLFSDMKCICAYEEERLSKVKSDSSFPKLAIEECLRNTNTKASEIKEINLSHWFNKKAGNDKYSDIKYLKARFKNARIFDELNHHDQHAISVWNFSGLTNGLTVVIDGFGNNEEVISLYRDGTLIDKIVGYENSLGLMYQYATSAAGLKENEDEYKLLGYEIHSKLQPYSLDMPKSNIKSNGDLINYGKLLYVKHYWHDKFNNMSTVDIAKLVQYNLETKVIKLIKGYLKDGELLQLSGGVFYNVKLNNLIVRTFRNNTICINPVCGDQGNIFGVTSYTYNSLFLGIRTEDIDIFEGTNIMNRVSGDMEFGPRALGNTSTLALPTMDNVKKINSYNNRNTVMPMAPIVTREFFNENFINYGNVHKSEKYMIVSFDYKNIKEEWKGAAHYDPDRDVYTGRVQVLDTKDELYGFVQSLGGILINTSLNYHGTPILYKLDDYHDYKSMINL